MVLDASMLDMPDRLRNGSRKSYQDFKIHWLIGSERLRILKYNRDSGRGKPWAHLLRFRTEKFRYLQMPIWNQYTKPFPGLDTPEKSKHNKMKQMRTHTSLSLMLCKINDNRKICVWEEEYSSSFWLDYAPFPLAHSPSQYNAIISAQLFCLSEDDRVPRTQNCLKDRTILELSQTPRCNVKSDADACELLN